MTDLRVGSQYDHPMGLFAPLEARGPAWLSFSLGPVIASAASAGLPAAILPLLGQSLSVIAVASTGGFLFICLSLALMICTSEHRTGSNLFACLFGIGHTFLIGLLAAAYFIPGGREISASLLNEVPFIAELPIATGMIGAVAPLFLLAFVTYSVLAPVSFLLLRYLALSRPDPRQI